MSERTPKTSTVRYGWIKGHPFPCTTDIEERGAEFDRMIAQVRAETLREAHSDLQAYTDAGAPFGHRPVEEFLLARADRIEKEAGL